MIRAAIRRIGIYYYILPNAVQARRVMFDGITSDGDRIIDYIPKELVDNINIQQMKIVFKNGSIIQFVGSDRFDSLRGTNPVGVVMSEYAYQHPMVYPTIRPILSGNNGWIIAISCVAPNTLVIGKNGLKRIKDVSYNRQEYSALNEPIYGLNGFHNAEQFYYGGKQPTRIIELESGYEIECTPIHPIWNGKEWIRSQDLKVGDLLPIQYGQDVWGEGLDLSEFVYKGDFNKVKNNIPYDSVDFPYLLGLIHADGNYNKNAVCITKKKDPEIIEFVKSFGFKTRDDGIHHEFSSRPFCALLEYMGFKHGATNKEFPEMLFDCSKEEMKSFLQGLFDGDGTSNSNKSKRGNISLSSTCKKFMKDLQIILLNFGIASAIYKHEVQPTKKVSVPSIVFSLEISGYFAYIFYRDIGFRLKRKQVNKKYIVDRCKEESGNVYPVDTSKLEGYMLPKNIITNKSRISRRLIKKLYDRESHPYLKDLLSEKFFYSPIKRIRESESEVFDFVIPETHSFFSNGFISHNTPQGHNHFYDLYKAAEIDPDNWYRLFLTVDDTKHISRKDIEKEIESGEISMDMAEQEYSCSFSLGAIGAYYAKYLNQMETNNQVGPVDWEPNYPVHTAWDLGVRDSTCILFFQVINRRIQIIDMYQKSDVGLEHYIHYLQSLPYTFGRHIAPNDIEVRDFTAGGMTRKQKAAQLGIKFTVAPKMSIMDGIESVRSTLSRIYIDSAKCAPLVKALRNYRKEYNTATKTYKDKPLHDHHSHVMDATRYLCIALPKVQTTSDPEALERRYQETMYGHDQSNMPSVFRNDVPNSHNRHHF